MPRRIQDGRGRWPARQPLTEAQRDLAARHLSWARSLARPYQRRWLGLDDEFESAACWGLCCAARTYDAAGNVVFVTYAKVPIRWALTDVQRARVPKGYLADRDHAPLIGPLSHPEAPVLAREPEPRGIDRADDLEYWLRKLPRRNAEVCRLIYGRGLTHRAAAAECRCSYARIHRVNRESLVMLSEVIGTCPGR